VCVCVCVEGGGGGGVVDFPSPTRCQPETLSERMFYLIKKLLHRTYAGIRKDFIKTAQVTSTRSVKAHYRNKAH